jgi:DNA-binding NtrC family response regulator
MEELSVLVVDDETRFLETLAKRLRLRKLEVHGVGSAEEALEFLSFHTLDVVLLDVKLPGMNGLDALREIEKWLPQVEVIVLSGHADIDTASAAIEPGAFDYLMKPMEIDSILYELEGAYQSKTLKEARARRKDTTPATSIRFIGMVESLFAIGRFSIVHTR